MKKIIIFTTLGLLTLFSPLFSQSLAGSIWQLQNPLTPSSSEVLYFYENDRFSYTVMNMQTLQTSFYEGDYEVDNGQLWLYLENGNEYVYSITKHNEYTLHLLYSDGVTSNFALYGSSYDQYMQNYANSIGVGYNNFNVNTYNNVGGGGYNSGGSNSQQRETHICVSCYGDGTCHVCGGTGTYRIYGQSNPCSACAANKGRCSICGGKGKY